MPMFEYQCTGKKCKNIYTELAKFEDEIACPKCGKPGTKLIATTNHPVFVHRHGTFIQRTGRSKRRK